MGHNYPVRDKQLSYERAHELLQYDAETGHLFWKKRVYRVGPGRRAGHTHKLDRYRYVGIDHVSYPEHRVIWLMVIGVWPEHWIDHKNGDRSDNRFANLRVATPAQNNANKAKNVRNSTGRKGVKFSPTRGKFVAHISYRGKDHYLGTFDCIDKASLAYQRAAERFYKEFANPN
jgi:hypothetical protein